MERINRKNMDWVRVSVVIRREQREKLQEKGINISEFVREKIDEFLYIPLFVIEVEGAEKGIPEGSVILLPVEKKGEIKVAHGGRRYIREGRDKYYVKIEKWKNIRKRRYVYVYE